MKFDWDENKARANRTKHGVSFIEAKSVFVDDFARLKHDPDHSVNEDRFLLLGISSLLRILVVVFVELEDETFRLISARKATRNEASQYRRFKL